MTQKFKKLVKKVEKEAERVWLYPSCYKYNYACTELDDYMNNSNPSSDEILTYKILFAL